MKKLPNFHESRLPRASLEQIPNRLAVVEVAVDQARKIAHSELAARVHLQETSFRPYSSVVDRAVKQQAPTPVQLTETKQIPQTDDLNLEQILYNVMDSYNHPDESV